MLITRRLQRLNLSTLSSKPKLLFIASTFFSHSIYTQSQFSQPRKPSKSTIFDAPRTTFKAPCTTTLINPSTQQTQQEGNPVETQVPLSVEKLFFPPEVDVPTKIESLSARVLNGSNIVLGKYGSDDDAKTVSAEFVKSSVEIEQCPSDGFPEFAIVGRSNVGKSSLLNSIVKRRKLALTSKKPGKTQCINHFIINDSWYLVDLPGYGYAKAPRDYRVKWDKFTRNYFMNRPTLVSVFLLIDASIPAKKSDLEYAQWLGQNQIPMTIIFTKCDKRMKKKNGWKRPEENVEVFQQLIRNFFQTTPPWIMSSGLTNQGREEILLHISQLRNYWLKH